MKIVVNDANILIDLVELELLSSFFALNYEFLTTDLVLDELFQEQAQKLEIYINDGTLIIHEMKYGDLEEIYTLHGLKAGLSEQDLSAFNLAQKRKGTLLTSDNTLRKFAHEQKVEVHGHLWVLDRMFEAGTITGPDAIGKLNELIEKINPKLVLPKKECEKRIKFWKRK